VATAARSPSSIVDRASWRRRRARGRRRGRPVSRSQISASWRPMSRPNTGCSSGAVRSPSGSGAPWSR
jgi:hypothetical protein